MQTSSRRLPTVTTIEDTRTPPPVQFFFPYRRHSSNPKTSKLSTPINERQQTLTQIVPSFSRLSSSFDSFDGAEDLEFDVMPPKKRQRRKSKQSNFPPQKQTITQMDPFRHQVDSDENQFHSDTEPPHRPSQRKKRKSTLTTPVARTVQTRSAKKRAAEADAHKGLDLAIPEDTHQPSNAQEPCASPLPESQHTKMPPPKTPTAVRRKVIPSSQSPADTPISTFKRSSKQARVVTPLRERSVNTPSKSQATLRRKNVLWAPKLEVADSTDVENEDSQFSFPTILQGHPTAIDRSSAPPSPAPSSKRPSDPLLADDSKIDIPLRASPKERSLRIMKRTETVADSDDDAVDRASPNSRRSINDEMLQSPTRSIKDISKATKTRPLIDQDHGRIGHALLPCDEYNRDSDSFETIPTQPLQQPTLSAKLGPNLMEAQPQTRDLDYALISEEDTAEPAHEIPRFSSPIRLQCGPVLETESQFENAWRDYTPPLENAGGSSRTDGEGAAVDTPHAHEPSLPLVSRRTNTDSSTNLQSLPPIPPSQATTVDQTQASLRQTQLHQVPARSTGLPIPSSPSQQRQALSSSSPFHTRKGRAADTYMGYQGWNGVPMTESQLLPDSLLNDSPGLPLMPGLEEGLELELED
ncbi:MAG: hypothetical protein Q9226_006576 [Calogaya cf. arnoldii]